MKIKTSTTYIFGHTRARILSSRGGNYVADVLFERKEEKRLFFFFETFLRVLELFLVKRDVMLSFLIGLFR